MTQRGRNEITIQTVQEIHAAASLHRLCVVIAYPSREAAPEPGTGTAVRHCGELFVVTCAHVAKDFFGMHGGELLFRQKPRIPRTECSLPFCDESMDLAVIHIHRTAAAKLSTLQPLTVSDFGSNAHFQQATARSKLHYVVAGFPGALAKIQTDKHLIELSPMVIGTKAKRRRGMRLELNYEHALKDHKLVAAEGMSGALVFEMHEPQSSTLWQPGVAIAVQHAWNEVNKALVCSPVSPCIDAILRFCNNGEPHA